MLFLPQSQKSRGTGNTVEAPFQMWATSTRQAALVMAFFFLPFPQSVKAQKSKISHPRTTQCHVPRLLLSSKGFPLQLPSTLPQNLQVTFDLTPASKPNPCPVNSIFKTLSYVSSLNMLPFPHLRTLAHAFLSSFFSALIPYPLCLLWKAPCTETLPPLSCLSSSSLYVDSTSMP